MVARQIHFSLACMNDLVSVKLRSLKLSRRVTQASVIILGDILNSCSSASIFHFWIDTVASFLNPSMNETVSEQYLGMSVYYGLLVLKSLAKTDIWQNYFWPNIMNCYYGVHILSHSNNCYVAFNSLQWTVFCIISLYDIDNMNICIISLFEQDI